MHQEKVFMNHLSSEVIFLYSINKNLAEFKHFHFLNRLVRPSFLKKIANFFILFLYSEWSREKCWLRSISKTILFQTIKTQILEGLIVSIFHSSSQQYLNRKNERMVKGKCSNDRILISRLPPFIFTVTDRTRDNVTLLAGNKPF